MTGLMTGSIGSIGLSGPGGPGGSTIDDDLVLGRHVHLDVDDACSDADAGGAGSRAPGLAMSLSTASPALLPAADASLPGTGTTARDIAEQAELVALVARVVYQDEAALAALYRHLSSRVYRQALRLTRQVQTAEEVVEDVFWQVWRQAPRFDATRGVVLAWVTQITRSRALDALRAMGRDPLHEALEIQDGDDLHAGADSCSDHDDPQALLDRAQLNAQVNRAMAALDPLRRQLVALAFQRGYSQAEIAQETGMPLGTVKSHLRRALAAMKLSLEAAPRPGRHMT
jgi:RNA polymerase sigma-70 factor, ECF subfamily